MLAGFSSLVRKHGTEVFLFFDAGVVTKTSTGVLIVWFLPVDPEQLVRFLAPDDPVATRPSPPNKVFSSWHAEHACTYIGPFRSRTGLPSKDIVFLCREYCGVLYMVAYMRTVQPAALLEPTFDISPVSPP